MTLLLMNSGFRSFDAFQHLPDFSVKEHAVGGRHEFVGEAMKQFYFEILFQILELYGKRRNRQFHQARGPERAAGADGKIKCVQCLEIHKAVSHKRSSNVLHWKF